MVLLLFTMIPCIILGTAYLRSTSPNWKQDILSEYQSTTDNHALSISRKLTELSSKQHYLINNHSVRNVIAQINRHNLVQKLEMINTLEEMVSSVSADNQNLRIRWYPYQTDYAYGSSCLPFEQFQQEFYKEFPEAAIQNSKGIYAQLYQEILSLKDGEQLLMVRNASEQTKNNGNSDQRLCLYTQMRNLNGSNCILEFCVPLSWILQEGDFTKMQNSNFVLRLGIGEQPLYLIQDAIADSEESREIRIWYSQLSLEDYLSSKGTTDTYEVIVSMIPNVKDSTILCLVPNRYIQELMRPRIFGFLMVSLICILLVISSSYITSHLLTRKVVDTMNTINDDLDSYLEATEKTDLYEEDIGHLAQRVKELIQNTKEYYSKMENYEAQNLRMELELLQLRFNPHLLYNTLGAIRCQATPKVRQTIDSLCKYYRIVLNNGYQIIQIKDELEMIKDYLEIEKFAYMMDDLHYVIETEEEVLSCTIIKHVLQPIVENALLHGIRSMNREGLLKIKAFSEEENICISISDNGIGMSSEEIAMILSAPQQSTSKGGYGIYNVQQRIMLYYGETYGIEIESVPGQGTTVSLRIPKITS